MASGKCSCGYLRKKIELVVHNTGKKAVEADAGKLAADMENFRAGFLGLGAGAGGEFEGADSVAASDPRLEVAPERVAGNKQRAHEGVRLPLHPAVRNSRSLLGADLTNIDAPTGDVGALGSDGVKVRLLTLDFEALLVK